MYEKNLVEDLRLRLSTDDMNYLRELSRRRSVSISECIRSIIGEYRRADTKPIKERKLPNGDTETYINTML